MVQFVIALARHSRDRLQWDLSRRSGSQFRVTVETTEFLIVRLKISSSVETHPHVPPVSNSYRGTSCTNSELKSIIQKWLSDGLVPESQSSYAVPVLLVRRKGSTWRLLTDYKRSNAIRVKEKRPFSNMLSHSRKVRKWIKTYFEARFEMWILEVANRQRRFS